MSKRLVFQTGIGICLVGVAYWLTSYVLSPFPGITPDNCNRIRPGMTIQAVEYILGASATKSYSYLDDSGKVAGSTAYWYGGRWTGAYIVQIEFGPDGTVNSVSLSLYGIGPAPKRGDRW
jgi:hypothetical protein